MSIDPKDGRGECGIIRPDMNEQTNAAALPLPTIRRYPIYLRCIKEMIAAGDLHISSAVLADRLGLDPVLTRKDLAMSGVIGGGGLGKIALSYGYYRYQTNIMIVCVILLVLLVQVFQTVGTLWATRSDKRLRK